MKTKLTLTPIIFVGLMVLAQVSGISSTAAVPPDDLTNAHYKGGSTFDLVGAGPNVARCGAFRKTGGNSPVS